MLKVDEVGHRTPLPSLADLVLQRCLVQLKCSLRLVRADEISSRFPERVSVDPAPSGSVFVQETEGWRVRVLGGQSIPNKFLGRLVLDVIWQRVDAFEVAILRSSQPWLAVFFLWLGYLRVAVIDRVLNCLWQGRLAGVLRIYVNVLVNIVALGPLLLHLSRGHQVIIRTICRVARP